jgi:O-antigen/teichoic acid export membrane protein
MQRKFILNLALVILLNVLVKPFYIVGIDAEFLKRIEEQNPGEYGMYFSLLGLTFILNIFLDAGINNYNTRLVARNPGWVQKQFASLLTARFMLVGIYFSLLFSVGAALGYDEAYFGLLAILGLNQVLVAFILFIRSTIAGLHFFKQDSFISVVDRLILVVLGSLILWGNVYSQPLSVELFAWMQTFAYGITLLLAVSVLIWKGQKINFTVQGRTIKTAVKKSLPYALLILLMMMYYRMDSVMIERMLPEGGRKSALYAQGFRFFEAFSMIGYLFAGLLLPIFSRMLKDRQSVSGITLLSAKLIFAGSFVLSAVMWYHSSSLISWRFDVENSELLESSLSFSLLMIAFVGMCLTYIYGTLLTANGNLKVLNYMAFGGVVMNAILNFIFIPEFGIIGAAFASMITQLVTSFVQMVLAHRIIRLEVRKQDFFSLILFSAVFALVMAQVPKDSISNLWLSISFYSILGLLTAWISGVLPIREMVKFIAKKTDAN